MELVACQILDTVEGISDRMNVGKDGSQKEIKEMGIVGFERLRLIPSKQKYERARKSFGFKKVRTEFSFGPVRV